MRVSWKTMILRKTICIVGVELASRVAIAYWYQPSRSWCKTAVAANWYQFNDNKCFRDVLWITENAHYATTHKNGFVDVKRSPWPLDDDYYFATMDHVVGDGPCCMLAIIMHLYQQLSAITNVAHLCCLFGGKPWEKQCWLAVMRTI